MTARLELGRAQILAFRRRVGALDERLPAGSDSLRRAAWAGLQDSMPRAAVLSVHARVEGTSPTVWEDPALAQVWGPRYSAYVVGAQDVAPFTLGRLAESGRRRQIADDLADRLHAYLDGRRMNYGDAGHALGVNPNQLRYAAPTGRLRIRWDGARRPEVWTVPPPDVEPAEARAELARRYLHVFGPATAEGWSEWAGIRPTVAAATFENLQPSLTPVRTPVGDAWILAADEPALGVAPGPAAPARLLPSGDAYYLLQGFDRALLVPDESRRSALWTSRVWPGAVLVDGEVVGTWRRSQATVTIETWRRLTPVERGAVEVEALSLPLPGIGTIALRWED